jgi:hypothetical protein
MPQVGFKPTIPASKQAKTVHALDHSATVTNSEAIADLYLVLTAQCQDLHNIIVNSPVTKTRKLNASVDPNWKENKQDSSLISAKNTWKKLLAKRDILSNFAGAVRF